jgi:XTP/dITP diphosphohydrolase
MENKNTSCEAFNRLLTIMEELRAGCPWDKKQTLESLRYLTIEETYELSDAILEKDLPAIKGELGDLMLHLVFYSKIASEQGAFDIRDVLNGICDKLIVRHPHIYGEVEANDAQTVKENWERIKLKEGKRSVLQGVPPSLPAMVKAYRIQEKARGVGFDWEAPHQVWDKVIEEMGELRENIQLREIPDQTEEAKAIVNSKIEDEFGDLLFALINYGRFIDINPEDALERTNKKFIRRFQYLEDKARDAGRNLHDMSLAEMDVFWEEAKKSE